MASTVSPAAPYQALGLSLPEGAVLPRETLQMLRDRIVAACGSKERSMTYNQLLKSYLQARITKTQMNTQVALLIGQHNMHTHNVFVLGCVRLARERAAEIERAAAAAGAAAAAAPAAQALCEGAGGKRPRSAPENAVADVRHCSGLPVAMPSVPQPHALTHTVLGACIHPLLFRDDLPDAQAALYRLRQAAQAASLLRVDAAAARLAAHAAALHVSAVLRHAAQRASAQRGGPALPGGDGDELRLSVADLLEASQAEDSPLLASARMRLAERAMAAVGAEPPRAMREEAQRQLARTGPGKQEQA